MWFKKNLYDKYTGTWYTSIWKKYKIVKNHYTFLAAAPTLDLAVPRT